MVWRRRYMRSIEVCVVMSSHLLPLFAMRGQPNPVAGAENERGERARGSPPACTRSDSFRRSSRALGGRTAPCARRARRSPAALPHAPQEIRIRAGYLAPEEVGVYRAPARGGLRGSLGRGRGAGAPTPAAMAGGDALAALAGRLSLQEASSELQAAPPPRSAAVARHREPPQGAARAVPPPAAQAAAPARAAASVEGGSWRRAPAPPPQRAAVLPRPRPAAGAEPAGSAGLERAYDASVRKADAAEGREHAGQGAVLPRAPSDASRDAGAVIGASCERGGRGAGMAPST